MSAISVVFTFLDDKNKSSVTKLRVPTGLTIPQYIEFVQGAAQIVANLTRSKVTNVSFCAKVDLSSATIRGTALAFSDIAEKALLIIRSSVAGLFSKMKIPTIDEDVLIPNTNTIDPANAEAAALITALEDGINVVGIGQVVQPIDLRGNDLAEVVTAKELFRKS